MTEYRLVISRTSKFNEVMASKPTIFTQADTILTLEGAARKGGRRVLEEDLGLLRKASMVVEKGRIAWIGPHAKVPKTFARAKEISMKGMTVLPGFVEC